MTLREFTVSVQLAINRGVSMVVVRRTKNHWLLIAAFGLIPFWCIASTLEKAPSRNPAAHGAEGAEKPKGNAQANAEGTKPQLATIKAEPKAQPASEHPADTHSAEHKNDSPKWTDKLNAVSAFITLLFTSILTVVAVMQNRLEKKLAEDSKTTEKIAADAANAAIISAETAKRQLAAQIAVQQGHIHVETKVIFRNADGLAAMTVAINLKNTGHTQITLETVRIKVHTNKTLNDTPSPLIQSINTLGWQISPGTNGLLNMPEKTINEEYHNTVTGLWNRTHALWVYGAIPFSDDVGGRRIQKFCHRLEFHAANGAESAGWLPDGNHHYWGEEKAEAQE